MEGDFSPQPDYKGKGFSSTCVIFKGFNFTMDHLISINCITNIFNECKSVGFLFPKKDIFVVNYLFFLRGGGGVIYELMTLKNKKSEISNFVILTLAKSRNL